MTHKSHLPSTMRAVFVEKPGGNLVIRETELPVPGPGEVLVKIAAAPVNPSDISWIRNAAAGSSSEPSIPGLEGSGIVVEAGRGLLPGLWNGRRVACSSHYPHSGTWAEYLVTRAGLCFPLKKKVSYEQGAMTLVNPLTALAFFDMIRQGRHKAVINNPGASALGRMIELLAKKKGIKIINLVRNGAQAETLKGSGSEFVIDTSVLKFSESLAKLVHELKATILFDSTCSEGLDSIIEIMPAGSSVVIYGNLEGAEHLAINPRSLIDKDIRLSGFYLGRHAGNNGLVRNMLDLMKVGSLMSSQMKIQIAGKYPLEKAGEALSSYTANMSAGKVLLIP